MDGIITIGHDDNLYLTVWGFHNTVPKEYYKTNLTLWGFHNTVPKEYYKTKAQNFEDDEFPDGRSGILRITQDGQPVEENGILGNEYPLNLYYAYGIRNSFGLDFDPVTGILWDTENGPDNGDEINLVGAGFNSGSAKIWGKWLFDAEGDK